MSIKVEQIVAKSKDTAFAHFSDDFRKPFNGNF
jgi:hypothetical protein